MMTAVSPSRTPDGVSRGVIAAAVAGTFALALGAFLLSFGALQDLARLAGIPDGQAWLWPLIVDGVILQATISVVALRDAAPSARRFAWMLLVAGTGVSVAANITHAVLTANERVPALVAALVASVPPLVLVAMTHLTVELIRNAAPRHDDGTAQGPSSVLGPKDGGSDGGCSGGSGGGGGNPPPPSGPSGTAGSSGTGAGTASTGAGAGAGSAGAGSAGGAGAGAGGAAGAGAGAGAAAGPVGLAVAGGIAVAKGAAEAGPKAGAAVGKAADAQASGASDGAAAPPSSRPANAAPTSPAQPPAAPPSQDPKPVPPTDPAPPKH